MEEVFLIEPSKEYKDEFAQMVQDYEKHGEIEQFNMYKIAIDDFDSYIKSLKDKSKGSGLPEVWGNGLPEVWVLCCTYWLVNSYNKILGVIRIRKELNSEFLKNIGGHIGYDICPSHRRNGYGNLILRLGLKKAKLMNITSVLLTCLADNYSSAKVIEKNGGIFDSEIFFNESNKFIRRYWINVEND